MVIVQPPDVFLSNIFLFFRRASKTPLKELALPILMCFSISGRGENLGSYKGTWRVNEGDIYIQWN